MRGSCSEKKYAIVARPTIAATGVGVLCLDGGGVRGTLVLEVLKRIEERVNLPVPLQRFVKIAFGISSGMWLHGPRALVPTNFHKVALSLQTCS